MQTITVQTSQNIEIEYELAGVGDRIVAYLVDVLIYGAYYFSIALLSTQLKNMSAWWGYAIFLPILLYQLLCEVLLNGQSIGKKVKNIRVISLDGNQPHIGQYLIRWLFRIIDTMMSSGLVAVLTVSLTDKSQRLGDILAGTTVVRTQRRTRIEDTVFVETQDNHQVKYPRAFELSDNDISLIKEVMNRFEKAPMENNAVLIRTAEKVKSVLDIHDPIVPEYFLKDILKDYNYLTSRTR
jgi:uncharacterized RDD family membrane protein YckC